MFKKILVANRGEIAVRVMRACREMGIPSVGVYSEVDRRALHVRKCDQAYFIGAAPARESYLNIPKLLEVAKRTGADAIHPGYGFLAENAAFARACHEAGVKFIGPTPESMEAMGSKTHARRMMQEAGVPMVPGTAKALGSLAEARQVAEKLGYPVMLKAAAGGGGKGMRMVPSAAEMESAFSQAQSEAERAFGDGEMYLEKFIEKPRHVEVQILADEHGHTVWLGERECSVQRRHQKVLEESPSTIVDAEMRRRMGETAVRVAQAAAYTNAGTVEFLVDAQRNFYFLEMNTRLQVEHPVTELVTGLDLVHLQIHIAAGEPLAFEQKDVVLRGHAMECRVYAEDPDNNFFPSPGKITRLLYPAGPGVRVDSGSYEGWVVPIDYDPLMAKLVGYAPTREQVIARLRRALDEYFVGGIKTNLPLFRELLRYPDFVAGDLDTGLLDRLLAGRRAAAPDEEHQRIAAIAAAMFAHEEATAGPAAGRTNGSRPAEAASAWKQAGRREGLRSK
jgi:acetyl-CoA carboxylase biotin carboxylase subunit